MPRLLKAHLLTQYMPDRSEITKAWIFFIRRAFEHDIITRNLARNFISFMTCATKASVAFGLSISVDLVKSFTFWW